MAGVDIALRHVHDYGVDGQFDPVIIRGKRRVISGYPLPFQAKASTNWFIKDGHVVYDLEAKTYNDIASRGEAESTLILVLLCLPKNQDEWHVATSTETTLQTCCYWQVIRGALTENDQAKRIKIPLDQILTPKSLNELLDAERLRREEQVQ